MTTPRSIDEALTAYRRFIESQPSPTRENYSQQEELRKATGTEPPRIIAPTGKEEQDALVQTLDKYFWPLNQKLRYNTRGVVAVNDEIYAVTATDVYNVNRSISVLEWSGEHFVGLGVLRGDLWVVRENGNLERPLIGPSKTSDAFTIWRNGDVLDAAGMADDRFVALTKTRRGYNLTDHEEISPVEASALFQTTGWRRTFTYKGYPFLLNAQDAVSVSPRRAFSHTEFYERLLEGSHD